MAQSDGQTYLGGPLALGLGLFLLSIFDIYFPGLGIPIVSIGGIGLLWAGIALLPRPVQSTRRAIQFRTSMATIVLIVIFGASSLWAVATFGSTNIKACLGLSMGAFTFLALVSRIESETFKKCHKVVPIY